MRLMLKALLPLALVAGVAGFARVQAQGGKAVELTAQDRAEIQELVGRYARALAECKAEEYADLFAPETGYFFSNIRGELAGRDHLIALVKSEQQCNPRPDGGGRAGGGSPPAGGGNSAARGNAGGRADAPNTGANRPVPTVTIESTPAGVKGVALLGNAGKYEDEYVKTPKGWKFKARTVITPREEKAGLSAADYVELRHLSGNDDKKYDDFYTDSPTGKRFRSGGIFFSLTPEGEVKGTAYLKGDGGRYEDVYAKGPSGWRFKSRTYVPAAEAK
jgi:SnoaL-like protein